MRKRRELLENARYHVSTRANRGEYIFNTIQVKELFLHVIRRAKKKFDFSIENFCIMGNHFHFIIFPRNGGNLSSIMQWILSVFAMSYNRLFGLTGHVWGERFFSRIIRDMRAHIAIFLYIDHNPQVAGLINESSIWEYGGLAHHREGRRDIVDVLPDWLVFFFSNHHKLLLT
jgi:putative transposase